LLDVETAFLYRDDTAKGGEAMDRPLRWALIVGALVIVPIGQAYEDHEGNEMNHDEHDLGYRDGRDRRG
jgi:hypothetical protein